MLRPAVSRAARVGIRPNHLTTLAIGVSALAGGAVLAGSKTPEILFVIPILYVVRMALNAMDGLLAREHAMTSRTGAMLNEIGDVVSDAIAYLPFAVVAPDAAWLVVTVVVIGLIGEVAALAASDDGRRRNDGPLGKSDRALAFGALAVLAAAGLQSVIAPMLVVLAGLGIVTIWNRATGACS
ncbi:MAG: CDP-alcohol phosphatidyltransferase family protein [Acidimicrobiia bacterium]|nr:CDP-alcohol phosphatidyltransferase family protein [Acidimicrobiia bacterium]